jgi:hypothetical protein
MASTWRLLSFTRSDPIFTASFAELPLDSSQSHIATDDQSVSQSVSQTVSQSVSLGVEPQLDS